MGRSVVTRTITRRRLSRFGAVLAHLADFKFATSENSGSRSVVWVEAPVPGCRKITTKKKTFTETKGVSAGFK